MANEHLAAHRPLILSRAAVAGVVGLVPIPVVDDWLAGAVRKELLRRIATARGVDITEAALAHLSSSSDSPTAAAVVTAVRLRLRRSLRRVAILLRLADHAGGLVGTYSIATLVDHYCARHHVGPGLDLDDARLLRAAAEGALADAPLRLARRGLHEVAALAGTVLAAAPRAARRRLPSIATARAPLVAEQVAPGTRPRRVGRNPIARGVDAIARALDSASGGYLDELVAAFDRRWGQRVQRPAPT